MSAQPIRCAFARSDLDRFRAAIVQHAGLHFDDGKLPFLSEVLQRRLDRLSCSSANYLERLESRSADGELRALAPELTVGETYFFRHNDQFRALAETVLPERMRARGPARALRLLSAGCASGEEPYSLAIVARETIADPSWTVSIRAVDLNPTALARAARACYSLWALRDAPLEVRRKWFRADNGDLVLDEAIRGAVAFGEGNLAGDDPEVWQSSAYDVIFCRNVLMYFSPEQMHAAIVRIAQSLAPGGYLFLGHAETLRGVSDAFQLCHTHDTFYYKRRDDFASTQRQRIADRTAAVAAPALAPAAAAAAAAVTLSTAWVDTIRQASERVAILVPATAAQADPTPAEPAARPLEPIFELLRQDRLCDALDHVCGGTADNERDPDVLLIKAALLAQSCQLAAAEDVCRRLLATDGSNPAAHYVLALCSDHAGEPARALAHDCRAAHFDPAFAMPRLHAGLLARRAGQRELAQRELTRALVLLEREDVTRLLLFGGGFARDALMALCRSALAACGDRP